MPETSFPLTPRVSSRSTSSLSCAETEHAPARPACKIDANDLGGAEVCTGVELALAADDDQQSHRCREIAGRARRSGSLRPRPGPTLPPAPQTSHDVDALAAAQRDRFRTKAAAGTRPRSCAPRGESRSSRTAPGSPNRRNRRVANAITRREEPGNRKGIVRPPAARRSRLGVCRSPARSPGGCMSRKAVVLPIAREVAASTRASTRPRTRTQRGDRRRRHLQRGGPGAPGMP
jgi:hypothetical protein